MHFPFLVGPIPRPLFFRGRKGGVEESFLQVQAALRPQPLCQLPLYRRQRPQQRTHCRKRRWQVWYGGYFFGNSCHCAPVPKIHKTPFNTARGSFGGRPFPSDRRSDRKIGSIKAHCSSLTSQRPYMGLVFRQIARAPLVCPVSATREPSFFCSSCERTIF